MVSEREKKILSKFKDWAVVLYKDYRTVEKAASKGFIGTRLDWGK